MDTPLCASPLLCPQAATGSVIAGARVVRSAPRAVPRETMAGIGSDGLGARGAGRAGRDRRQAVPGPSGGGGVPDHVRPGVRRAGRGRARQRPARAGRGQQRPVDRRAEPGPSVRGCRGRPEVRNLERGTDVVSWVMSVNVHRHHLDASQRGLAGEPAVRPERRGDVEPGRRDGAVASGAAGCAGPGRAGRPPSGPGAWRDASTRAPDVVAPAHPHERLEPGGGRPGRHVLHFRGADKFQPERPRGADPEVTLGFTFWIRNE